MITFNLESLADRAALYYRYPQQSNPQPAYVEMDEEGEVSADYSGEIGNGTPMHVWNGRTLRWPISPNVDCHWLRGFIRSDEVRPLLERVHAGHSVDWDGRNNRGKLTDDALDASYDFERLLDRRDHDKQITVYTASGWLFEGPQQTLLSVWDDEPFDDVVSRLEQEAANWPGERIVITDSIRDELLNAAYAYWCDYDDREELKPCHIDALVAAGKVRPEDVAAWRAEEAL